MIVPTQDRSSRIIQTGILLVIAAATLGTTGSLGVAIPVGRLPEAWRKRIEPHTQPRPAAAD